MAIGDSTVSAGVFWMDAATMPQGELAVLRAVLRRNVPSLIERDVGEGEASVCRGYLVAVHAGASVPSKSSVVACWWLWTRRRVGEAQAEPWEDAGPLVEQLRGLSDVLQTDLFGGLRVTDVSALAVAVVAEGTGVMVEAREDSKRNCFVVKAMVTWHAGSEVGRNLSCCLGKVAAKEGVIAALYARVAWALQLNDPRVAAEVLGWGTARTGLAAVARERLGGGKISVAIVSIGRRMERGLVIGSSQMLRVHDRASEGCLAQHVHDWYPESRPDFSGEVDVMIRMLDRLEDDLSCLAIATSGKEL